MAATGGTSSRPAPSPCDEEYHREADPGDHAPMPGQPEGGAAVVRFVAEAASGTTIARDGAPRFAAVLLDRRVVLLCVVRRPREVAIDETWCERERSTPRAASSPRRTPPVADGRRPSDRLGRDFGLVTGATGRKREGRQVLTQSNCGVFTAGAAPSSLGRATRRGEARRRSDREALDRMLRGAVRRLQRNGAIGQRRTNLHDRRRDRAAASRRSA